MFDVRQLIVVHSLPTCNPGVKSMK